MFSKVYNCACGVKRPNFPLPTRMHSSRMRKARGSSRPWGRGLRQCMLGYTTPPWVWAWRPTLGVGLETPPQVWACRPPWPDSSASHLGVGLETPPCKVCWDTTCKACWDTTPPNTCKACWDTTPSPWTEFLTHASENISLPQTSFAGGNNVTNISRLHILSANVVTAHKQSLRRLCFYTCLSVILCH